MSAPDASDVLAVVLTYDAPEALDRCLHAIEHQHCPPGAVLVVDNASRRSPDDVIAAHPGVQALRLPENVGPAGGYAAALTAALDTDAQYVWILDDDCAPVPDALAKELAIAGTDRIVLATATWAETGTTGRTHGWLAVLLPRAAIEQLGVPDPDLFWWTEDTEYLQWRLPRGGFPVVYTDDPVVTVRRGRADASKPAWKYFYETRNQVFYRLHTQRVTDRPRPRHLRTRVRVWRALRSTGKLGARALLRERDQRVRKFRMVARGAIDGWRGRLGKTVPADVADRPST